MLGLEGAGYSSLVEYKNQMFQINLKPFYKFVEQNFEKQLLPEFLDTKGVYVEFLINAMLEGDPALQAQIAAVALGGNAYMGIDEWRGEVLNKAPLPPDKIPQARGGIPTSVGNQFAGLDTATPAVPATATPKFPRMDVPEPPTFSFTSLGEGLAAIRSKYIDIFRTKNIETWRDKGELFLFLQAYVNDVTAIIPVFVPGRFDRGKTVAYLMKQSELYSKHEELNAKDITERVLSWAVREFLQQNGKGPQEHTDKDPSAL